MFAFLELFQTLRPWLRLIHATMVYDDSFYRNMFQILSNFLALLIVFAPLYSMILHSHLSTRSPLNNSEKFKYLPIKQISGLPHRTTVTPERAQWFRFRKVAVWWISRHSSLRQQQPATVGWSVYACIVDVYFSLAHVRCNTTARDIQRMVGST